MNYDDFMIRVSSNDILASSIQGEHHGKFDLDLNEINLSMNLVEENRSNLKLLESLGERLFHALFPTEIFGQFKATMAGAEEKRSGVRIRLVFDDPEFAALPWEFLYDNSTNTFLANDPKTALSRYIDVPSKKQDIKTVNLPLKILLIISSPKDLGDIDSEKEESLIRQSLESHISAGLIEIDVLREATVRDIDNKIIEKTYNIIHFIGHGIFKNNKGHIALVDENGNSRNLDDEHFSNLFLVKQGIGLVVLNSCQSATKSSNQVFGGIATRLVQKGLPAVIAMQYPISDRTAIIFADKFYKTLSQGLPVDEAVQSTRKFMALR